MGKRGAAKTVAMAAHNGSALFRGPGSVTLHAVFYRVNVVALVAERDIAHFQALNV